MTQETLMESTLEMGSKRLLRRLVKNRRPTWQGGSQLIVLLLFGFNIMTRWRESIVEVFWFLQFQCFSPFADMWCQPFSRASL